MELVAGLSVCVLILTSLAVAIKTFLLWLRSRDVPALLLAGMLTCATLIGYPLAIASFRMDASQMWPVHLAAVCFTSLGYVWLLLFVQRVFRPGSRAAAGGVALLILFVAVSDVVYGVALAGQAGPGLAARTRLNLLVSVSAVLTYLWSTVEALRYWQQLRLRLRVGLVDPLVANRVLLWGLMSLANSIAIVANVAAMLRGVNFSESPLLLLVSSVLGLAQAACLFLAFHPPGWYGAWIEQRHALAAG